METINNGMCRCCASEGTFKDVKTKYVWMGEDEVYSQMLQECFDITLADLENEDGGICEVCITQLRNATNFKKQVLFTENKFRNLVKEKPFKGDIVKIEFKAADEDNDSDNNLSDGFSATDFDVPVKMESPDEPKAKKRPAKPSTSRVKKLKADEPETSKSSGWDSRSSVVMSPNVSKNISSVDKGASNDWTVTIKKVDDKVEQEQRSDVIKKENVSEQKEVMQLELKPAPANQTDPADKEIKLHLSNLHAVLLHSNSSPIRLHNSLGFHCAFCEQHFRYPADLKTHSLENHNLADLTTYLNGLRSISAYVIQLDITDLKCYICKSDIENVNVFLEHLKSEHDKNVFTNINSHILQFKFNETVQSKLYKCVFCESRFEYFKLLRQHMPVHYRNYVCSLCDAAFITSGSLNQHIKTHSQGLFACSVCDKSFGSSEKRRKHEKMVHDSFHNNKCRYCDQTFENHNSKMKHMIKEHRVTAVEFKCKACSKTFVNRRNLTVHTKRDHLMERNHSCDVCKKRFFLGKELKNHMLTHTGDRKYQCDICSKSYGRRSTLREHMRIHADDRRFKCEYCEMTFVQKCSMKGHMLSKHSAEMK